MCDDDFFDYTVGKCVDTSLEVQECGQSQYDNDTARVFVGLGCYEPLADETQCLTEVPGGRWVTRERTQMWACVLIPDISFDPQVPDPNKSAWI